MTCLIAGLVCLITITSASVSVGSSSHVYAYTVTIDPGDDSAVDSQDCLPSSQGNEPPVPCQTLNFALQSSPRSSVKFYLASPNATYLLTTANAFTNEDNLAFIGSNLSYPTLPTVKCLKSKEASAGLAFINSSNIVLKNVRFSHCGAWQDSTSRNFSAVNSTALCQFRVSLYFSNCTNVDMNNIRVENSSKATGVVMYNTVGKILIEKCKFTNNRVNGSEGSFGGGAFAVEFTYCRPGDDACDNEHYDITGHNNRDATYNFTDCLFQNNRASGQSLTSLLAPENFILPHNATHEAFGRGGGLSVYFKGNAVNNSIAIYNCRFIKNHAVWGGGLLIEMDDNTINNSVSVTHCLFERNRCNFNHHSGTGGGALRVATTTRFWDNMYRIKNLTASVIDIGHCTFTQNTAFEGGGLSVAISHQDKSHPLQVAQISISQCTFQSNVGRIGSAVEISLYRFFTKGHLSHVRFIDCVFVGNRINDLQQPISFVEIGAVYVTGIEAIFSGTMNFTANSGSALAVVGTDVDFSGCTAIFVGNTGSNGGGIALLGVSLLVIGAQTRMDFIDNYVTGYGGAIYNRYIEQETMKSNLNCFIHYGDPFVAPKDWDVHFYFKNNTALKLGKSIYSSSILPCSLARGKIDRVKDVFCWDKDRWIYDSENCSDEIYTSPRSFSMPETLPNIYPGREFNLQLNAVDDLHHSVTRTTVYSATVDRQHPAQFAEVDPRSTYTGDNYVTINGLPDRNFTLRVVTTSFPHVQIKINMTMVKCPPGFMLKSKKYSSSLTKGYNTNTCECLKAGSFRGYLMCYAKEWNARIPTGFWIGYVPREDSSEHLLMGYFPPIYSLHRNAKFHDNITLSADSTNTSLDETICGDEHRTGVLCGKCVDGFAVAVNSIHYECVLCNGTSTRDFIGRLIGYVVLRYLPVTIFLFIIFYFNIKLTSSAASGFVLYAQMIGSNIFNISGGKASYLDANSTPRVLQRMYRTVYGVFNLDSFANLLPPFCLNKNFSTLDVICLDYAIAVFPLLVIIATHCAYKWNLCRCKCLRKLNIDAGSRLSSKSLVHTFVAFILLSYTKFSIASISSLYTTQLFNSEGRTVSAYRIYLAGHLSLHSHQYLLPYGLIAIFVFIFIVLLPPLLLLGPLHFIDWLIDKPGYSCLRRIWPSIAVHTFLDTFQGFYRPNRRFFAGIYFLFRFVVFLSYCFTATTFQRYTIQQIVTLLMIVLISIFHPYKKSFFNHVDTLIFFNLAILNALALYTISASKTAHFFSKMYMFECILVWLPLLYMIFYLLWISLRHSKYYPKIMTVYLFIVESFKRRVKASIPHREPLQQFPQESAQYYEMTESLMDADVGIFRRAENKNTYHPNADVDGKKKEVKSDKKNKSVRIAM